jgi:hypothetical protein
VHDAFRRRDATALRRLFQQHAELRGRINDPVFSFNCPAIVAHANDLSIVDVLLEFGADPNRRSEWWAGGFHALHSATGAAAERLIAAGAIPDACAAAHLDRRTFVRPCRRGSGPRGHGRGGDGQTPLRTSPDRAPSPISCSTRAREIDAARCRSSRHTSPVDVPEGARRRAPTSRIIPGSAVLHRYLLAAALGLSDRVSQMLRADAGPLDLRTGQGPYESSAEQPRICPGRLDTAVPPPGRRRRAVRAAGNAGDDADVRIAASSAALRRAERR